mgnify:CR=1 FL=1|tara:strand:+ start:183 stop:512 length:330 start_codon:yes stop_codon:yes gene_type:complete
MATVWRVENLTRKTTVGSLSDVVTSIDWRAELTDSGHHASKSGYVELPAADSKNFTAYASITEANAVSWIKSTLGSDEVSATEASLTAQIEELKVPVEKRGIPWGPTPF